MLPRSQRVERSLFSEAFRGGRVFHSSNITLRFLKNETGTPKFSFVVPKAVSAKAVGRNLLRRRGYSIVRKLKNKIKDSGIFVFFLKKGLAKAIFKELENEITGILENANLLKK